MNTIAMLTPFSGFIGFSELAQVFQWNAGEKNDKRKCD